MTTVNDGYQDKYYEVSGVDITTGEPMVYNFVSGEFVSYDEFESDSCTFDTLELAQGAMSNLQCSDIANLSINEFSLTD